MPEVLLALKVPTFNSSRGDLSYEEAEDGLFGGISPGRLGTVITIRLTLHLEGQRNTHLEQKQETGSYYSKFGN